MTTAKTFRATVWTLSAQAACVDGDQAIRRQVIEERAESASAFEASIRDRYIHDVDNDVWFGPISEVTIDQVVARAILQAWQAGHIKVECSRNAIPKNESEHNADTEIFMAGNELTISVVAVGRVKLG